MRLSQSADLNPNEPLQGFLHITHSTRVAVICRIVRSINAVSVARGRAACENTKIRTELVFALPALQYKMCVMSDCATMCKANILAHSVLLVFGSHVCPLHTLSRFLPRLNHIKYFQRCRDLRNGALPAFLLCITCEKG